MTPIEWSLRIIPARKPRFLVSLAVTLAAVGAAFAVRLMVIGRGGDVTPTSNLFPALIVISLYAGWRWGLGVIVLLGGLVGYAAAARPETQFTAGAWFALALFFGSAAITVILAGAVRELLVRLAGEVRAREAAETHQQESEGRFRTLADAAPTPMWVTNPDRSRGFVNRAYIEFLRVSGEAALAHDWRSNVHPDDLDKLVDCTSSEHLGQLGSGFKGELASSGVDI